MLTRPVYSLPKLAVLALILAVNSSCGNETKYDWRNREIAWTYGPTTGAATSAHLSGTGKRGKPISEGWHCNLSDGKTLTVKPYKLTNSHPLFGKTLLIIGLFDKTGNQLDTRTTELIQKENATFSLGLSEDLAKKLYDIVIWYRRAA